MPDSDRVFMTDAANRKSLSWDSELEREWFWDLVSRVLPHRIVLVLSFASRRTVLVSQTGKKSKS